MQDLITEASDSVSNGNASISLKVTAPVEEGSVLISFIAFTSSPQALTALTYLGFGTAATAIVGGSLVALVQKLGNRKITNVTIEGGESEEAIITVGDEEIIVDRRLADLAVSKKARLALNNIIKEPLQNVEGSVFKVINEENDVVLEIPKAETASFAPLPKGSLEEEHIESWKTTVSFAQVNFSSSKGWKMILPNQTEKSVSLKDEKFLAKVNASQAIFKKEDLYEVEIELKTTLRPTRTTYEYSIIEVTKHFADPSRRIVK